MQIRVLGCSGGIGARARTTSFLVDQTILLDAGTGVEDLTVDELAGIDHVFLTHSHLDHIAALPLLIDSVGAMRAKPVVVHALAQTIAALKTHIFNWTIWPDFTAITADHGPWLVFDPIEVGSRIDIGDTSIRTLPAEHTVPAVAYAIRGNGGSLVFSGDTAPNDEFWRQVNRVRDLRYLIIESAFPERDSVLAAHAKHLYPSLLRDELRKLDTDAEVLVTHLKPTDRVLIEHELAGWTGRFCPRVLERGEVLDL